MGSFPRFSKSGGSQNFGVQVAQCAEHFPEFRRGCCHSREMWENGRFGPIRALLGAPAPGLSGMLGLISGASPPSP